MYSNVQLLPHKTQSMERRHPWIFSGALKEMPKTIEDGEVVAVLDSRNNEIAKGHFQHGSIAVRILTFANELIDQDFFNKRLSNAVELRKKLHLFREDNSICRLVHGEGDELPGLVIDYYGGVAVIQCHSLGMYLQIDLIKNALEAMPDGGTVVMNVATDEVIGDLTQHDDILLVAKGGKGGLGNMHFKSSTNRSPRKALPGLPGEERTLKLELKLLADVGLLGFPNAGKSTLIRAVSAATPKVADYPFTTLYPNLGVVRVGPEKSFVVADVPGLIEGASEGAGLGHQFLRHLQRTRLLLHLVDAAPFDESVDPVAQAKAIVGELKKYDPALHAKPRWLVLNKLDMVPVEEREARVKDIVRRLRYKGPVFEISALTREGTERLVQKVYEHIAQVHQAAQPVAVDPRFQSGAETA